MYHWAMLWPLGHKLKTSLVTWDWPDSLAGSYSYLGLQSPSMYTWSWMEERKGSVFAVLGRVLGRPCAPLPQRIDKELSSPPVSDEVRNVSRLLWRHWPLALSEQTGGRTCGLTHHRQECPNICNVHQNCELIRHCLKERYRREWTVCLQGDE